MKYSLLKKALCISVIFIFTEALSAVNLPDSIIYTAMKIDNGLTFRTGTATSFGHFTNYSYFKESGGTEHIAYIDNYDLYYFRSTNNGADWTKEKIVTGHEGDHYLCALTVDQNGKVFIGITIHSLFNYANPTGITSGFNYFYYDLYCVNNKTGTWQTELVSQHSASNYGSRVTGLYVDINNNVHLIANYYGWYSYGGTAWEWIRYAASNTWSTAQKIVEFLDTPVDRLIYDTYAIVPDQGGNVTIVMCRNYSSTDTQKPRLFYVRHNGTSWAAPVIITDNIAVAWNRFDALVDPAGHTYIAYLENNVQGLPELKVIKDFQPAVPAQLNIAATDTINYFRLHCNADGIFTMYLSVRNKTYSVLFSDDMINWSEPVYLSTEENKYAGGVIVKTDTRNGIFTDYCKQINAIAGQRASQPFGPDTLTHGSVRIDPATFTETEIFIPDKFILHQNYPNPFNPSTRISWQSPVSGHQTLRIYDVLGNEVATLVDEYREAGRYEVEFQSTVNSRQSAIGSQQLTSGIYFYRLSVSGVSGEFNHVNKMILLK